MYTKERFTKEINMLPYFMAGIFNFWNFEEKNILFPDILDNICTVIVFYP